MKPIKAWAMVAKGVDALDSGYNVDKGASQYFIYHDRADAVSSRKWWANSTGSSSRWWRLAQVEIRELPKRRNINAMHDRLAKKAKGER